MTLLENALALAARGIPVFPCRNDKSPACENGFRDASTDPDTVRALFADTGSLIGVPTGAVSGFDVVDVDIRDGGLAWWDANLSTLPITTIHTTRSGGYHILLQHAEGLRCSKGRIAPGVDVRADGGYAIWWVAAECPVWLGEDVAPWPAELLGSLARRPPAVQASVDAARLAPPSAAAVVALLERLPNPLDLDRDEYVQVMTAAAWCATATGDDLGEIETAAVAWAERWEGGGRYDEAAKWESDWSRRTAPLAGWQTLQAVAKRRIPGYGAEMAAVEFPALAPLPSRKMFGEPFALGNPADIEPREWVYGGHYIRQFISSTVAPGGLGKSSLALVEALDMVTGKGLLTGKPTGRRFRVVYWNGEDPIEETTRRVTAACLHYRLTADDIGDRLRVCSGRDVPIRIATGTRDGLAIAEPLVAELTAELRAEQVDVLILDPFVKTHGVNENDNSAIDAVATQFARVADATNVAIELVHHLRKASVPGQDRTAEDARGGVALISAARSVRVLNVMQAAEADSLGIAEEIRRRCFRVDDGKVNMVPPRGSGDHAIWRFLASISLGNARPERHLAGDNIGVVTAWTKPTVEDSLTPAHVAEITGRLDAGGPNRRDARSPDWVGHVVAEAMGVDLGLSGARKRMGKIVDALISQGVFSVGSVPNGKGREVEVISLRPQSPQSDCGVTVATVGTPRPTTPPH